MENLEIELLRLENRVRFILGVVNGEIIVSNRKRVDLFHELQAKGFTPFPKKNKSVESEVAGASDETNETEEGPEVKGERIGDYEYLLGLAIGNLTIEKVQELCHERDKLKGEVEGLVVIDDGEDDDEMLELKDRLAAYKIDSSPDRSEVSAMETGVPAKKKEPSKRAAAKKKTTPRAAKTSNNVDSDDNDLEIYERAAPRANKGGGRKKAAANANRTQVIYVASDSDSEPFAEDSDFDEEEDDDFDED